MSNIFALPTDTVYGLFTYINDTESKKEIFKLKKRDKSKPLSLYVNNLNQLKLFLNERTLNDNIGILEDLLPGPFTFILDSKKNIPFVTKKNKVGVRWVENKFFNSFVEREGVLCGTSLNISNQKEIFSLQTKEDIPLKSDKIQFFKGECKYKFSSLILESIGKNEFKLKRMNEENINILKNNLKMKFILSEDKLKIYV